MSRGFTICMATITYDETLVWKRYLKNCGIFLLTERVLLASPDFSREKRGQRSPWAPLAYMESEPWVYKDSEGAVTWKISRWNFFGKGHFKKNFLGIFLVRPQKIRLPRVVSIWMRPTIHYKSNPKVDLESTVPAPSKVRISKKLFILFGHFEAIFVCW